MKRIFRKDERGITLQTLIVTAVLVLMAGAAGVVIVSITNSQADNLEGQNAGIEARCEPWEIFDPTLEAAGRGGDGNGGLTSSAIGCRRVCYAVPHSSVSNPVLNAAARLADANNKNSEGKTVTTDTERWMLDFSRGTHSNAKASVVTGDRKAGTATALVGEHHRIEVSGNQRYCQVWDDSIDKEIPALRSS